MSKSRLIPFGKIIKPHGLNGHVVFKLYNDNLDISNLDHLFIDIGADTLPFLIEHIQALPKGFKIKFEEFSKLEDTTDIIGREAFLREHDYNRLLQESGVEEIPILEYAAFIENENQPFGKVVSVLENKYQNVIEIAHNSGAQVLVPWVEPFIVSIDHSNKKIIFRLPEGLLDMYLGKK